MNPKSRSLKQRKFVDAIATFVVRIGGLSILLSILAIFMVILLEVVPLFMPAELKARSVIVERDDRPVAALMLDPGSRWAATVNSGWGVRFSPIPPFRAASIEVHVDGAPTDQSIAASAPLVGRNESIVSTDRGDLYQLTFEFPPSLAAEKATEATQSSPPAHASARVVPLLVHAPPVEGGPPVEGAISPMPSSVLLLASARPESRMVAAAVSPSVDGDASSSQSLDLLWITEKKALSGPPKKKLLRATLPLADKAPAGSPESIASAIAVDLAAKTVFVGTKAGTLRLFDIEQPGTIRELESVRASTLPITAVAVLLGGETVIVGDGKGGVSSWMPVGGALASSGVLTKVHDFEPLRLSESANEPVIDIAISRRNRTFLPLSANGAFHLAYGTSGATEAEVPSGFTPKRIALTAKGDRVVVSGSQGQLVSWELSNPHAEISLGTLFGKVWYEGYPAPEYVWQSSSGNDEFEPKMSLIPLIFGSLKGTVYSLLFATPIALLAALYVSEFMSLRLKAYVKPLIELMAALPSVVIGFIAGLWLAPILGSRMPGLIILPLSLVLTVAAGAYCWHRFASKRILTLFRGYEAFIMVPLVILGFWVAFSAGAAFELAVCDGDFLHWIRDRFGIEFDQRNSIVVGIAMGFAVIPLIFTIAEDSLASVPKHLRAASLALGANRWQTALRVVLPAASPGIFSAIMLGFGRAVGETMIVLMATGNTPLMELSPFSGFRALSANIAVELPEAAQGGSLYRVLFLAALLLFLFAFLVNTVTEVVRVRLRRRYGQL